MSLGNKKPWQRGQKRIRRSLLENKVPSGLLDFNGSRRRPLAKPCDHRSSLPRAPWKARVCSSTVCWISQPRTIASDGICCDNSRAASSRMSTAAQPVSMAELEMISIDTPAIEIASNLLKIKERDLLQSTLQAAVAKQVLGWQWQAQKCRTGEVRHPERPTEVEGSRLAPSVLRQATQ
jgi:hypothetical protein